MKERRKSIQYDSSRGELNFQDGSLDQLQQSGDTRYLLPGSKLLSDYRNMSSLFHSNSITIQRSGPTAEEIAALSSVAMYESPSWEDCVQIKNSEAFARQMMEVLVQSGGQVLYENYLDTKMHDWVLKSMFFLSEFIWFQGRIGHDRDYPSMYRSHNQEFNCCLDQKFLEEAQLLETIDLIHEDSEPCLPGRENWRSYNVDVERQVEKIVGENSATMMKHQDSLQKVRKRKRELTKKQGDDPEKLKNISSKSFFKDEKESEGTKGGGQDIENEIGLIKDVMAISIRPIIKQGKQISCESPFSLGHSKTQLMFDKFNPEFVDMRSQIDIDRVEEQLRLLKERERELKQQKAEMDAFRLKEQKEQQQRLKMTSIGENSQRQFTFDYNGQVIGMNTVRMDKFPQQTIIVPHMITKGELIPPDDQSESFNQGRFKQISMKPKNVNQLDQTPLEIIKKVKPNTEILTNKVPNALTKKKESQNSLLPLSQAPSKQMNSISNKSQQQVQLTPQQSPQQIQIIRQSHKELAVQNINTQGMPKDVYFSPPQEIFDKFSVNKGVTLIEGGKIKKGPGFQTVLDTIDLTRLNEQNYGKSLCLSKNEYSTLISLNSSPSSQKFQKSKDISFPMQSHEDALAQLSFSQNNVTIPPINAKKNNIASLSLSSLHNQGVMTGRTSKNTALDPINSGRISVQSAAIFQTLRSAEESDSILEIMQKNPLNKMTTGSFSLSSPKSMQIPLPIPKLSNTSKTQMRPLDEFNQSIVKCGNLWGSFDTESSFVHHALISPSKISENYKEKCVIGNATKNPRDRLMKRSKQLMNHAHLGSPRIGDTMGHGFLGDGFNPNKLFNPDKFIDELRTHHNQINISNQSSILNSSQV